MGLLLDSLIVFLLTILALTVSGHMSSVGSTQTLHPVYERKIEFPSGGRGQFPYAVFDSTGAYVYLVRPEESHVQLIDWRQDKELDSRTFKGLPCNARENGSTGSIDFWTVLNDSLGILMGYCSHAYLIDPKTLDIKSTLPNGTISLSRNLLAEVVVEGDSFTGKNSIHILDLSTRSEVAVLKLPKGYPQALAFTADGSRLVAQIEEVRRTSPGSRVLRRENCTLWMWSTQDWKVIQQSAKCFVDINIPPGWNDAFVEILPTGFQVRHLSSGEVIRAISTDRRVSYPKFSHNGRWVAASVADDPADAPDYSQDFRIWDLQSGQTVYESPRRKWDLFGGRKYAPYVRLDWSPDDRYILVTRYGELAIYDLIGLK